MVLWVVPQAGEHRNGLLGLARRGCWIYMRQQQAMEEQEEEQEAARQHCCPQRPAAAMEEGQ